MYGTLPATGGFLNPLRLLFVVVAICVFGAGLISRRK